MTRTRLTAAERGEEVLDAAVVAFGASGYAGTRTDEIARLAGVSQPYVIRLFGTKQQLFLATVHRVSDRVEQTFRAAADEQTDLASLGKSYEQLLTERELLVVLLHGFAASAEPAIGDAVRERFGGIYRLVRELTGASREEAREFLATGMLLTVMAAMQVAGPNPITCGWSTELLDDL
ncbi:transcriptional regulator, TetR family [Kribbella flavida DSM 17836]|uniref:Transcriptional regulator, TetR family n=1 Tax=Kribbella flavida (strain DSM 17836 / JCM 10339 / NBRC 14399) TaxID=479435 RepID=D2PKM0_KRIFD|nr:TetR/AcrR family transcriptional regulator [Kribbella flavida]ADB30532.1 transcriptional regulator, TetR family [Kribbella flavida DSM 17836]